jgi:hypothetical protein
VIKKGLKCFGDPATRLRGEKDINNLIDRVLGQERRIARREFTKRCKIQAKKMSDPKWWLGNIQRVLLGAMGR